MNRRVLTFALIGSLLFLICTSYAPIDTQNYEMKAVWPSNPTGFVVFKEYGYTFTTGDGTYASIRLYTILAGFIDSSVATAAINGKAGSVYFVKPGNCKLFIEGTTSNGRKFSDSLLSVSVVNPFSITGKTTVAINEESLLSLAPAPAGMTQQAKVEWKVNGMVKASLDPAVSFSFSSSTVGTFSIAATISDAGQKNSLQLGEVTVKVQLNPASTYTVSVAAVNGTVTKYPDKAAYDSGSTIGLKAKAVDGYHFVSWSGDASGASDSIGITITSAKNIVANFEKNAAGKFPLSVTATNGSVTKTPDNTQYDSGSVVGLKAKPTAGYHFVNWSGDATGTVDSVTVIMTGTKSVTANFAANPIPTYSLSITANNGTVTKTPDKTAYDSGSTVSLKAKPAGGFHFVNWSGGATGTSDSITVLMNSAKNITANFEANAIGKFSLAVTATNGSVTRTPDKTQYDSGATVTLTANPAPGYRFNGWSGDLTSANPSESIVMTSAKNITANFVKKQFTVTITNPNGSVLKDPNQSAYDSSSTVKLTATGSTGYHFSSWSGDFTSTTNPTSVTVIGNMNITANFVHDTFTVTFTPDSNGTISGVASQRIVYGGNCTAVTAVPKPGYKFNGWSGGFTGTDNPLTVKNVTDTLAITATFTAIECNWSDALDVAGTSIFSLGANQNSVIAGLQRYGCKLSLDNGGLWNDLGGSIYYTAVTFVGSTTELAGTGFNSGTGVITQWLNNGGSTVSTGIGSGDITSFAVSGNTVIVSATSGVFRSTDGGATWDTYYSSPSAANAVVISGSNTIAACPDGIYSGTLNGLYWSKVSSTPIVQSLAVCNNNLFAADSTNGVYKSTNNGGTWAAANTGLPGGVYTLAVSGTMIFAGTKNGVYLSTNNGANWFAVNTGLPAGPFSELAVNSRFIFAANFGGRTVWKSALPQP
jgi:uncharacterized repeat protein (TIGR02543 family)